MDVDIQPSLGHWQSHPSTTATPSSTTFSSSTGTGGKRRASDTPLLDSDVQHGPDSHSTHSSPSFVPTQPSEPEPSRAASSSSKRMRLSTSGSGRAQSITGSSQARRAGAINRSASGTLAGGNGTAALLTSLQGSVNAMTGLFQQTLTSSEDRASNQLSHAIQMLTIDDDVFLANSDEKIAVLHTFINSPATCNAYTQLTTNAELRRAFLRSLLVPLQPQPSGSGAAMPL